ncbi:hypothetical protein L596_026409 [Steinernema carpocapsae]|uniref:7TM GPCR serpentine receptor class x (Srx) domain-containing protein n=1 Tax=Steinernema carpocapsae TaxID=34508 RepID=A0A4U5M1E5_STECR|nr:hypothetical protein L596_026409 [Steinernema carpocapsae]
MVVICSVVFLAIAFVFYLITVVVILRQRLLIKSESRSRVITGEIRLFVQGILDFLFAIAMELAFYYAPRTNAAMIAIEVAFILYNGFLNPIAYLVINKRIRNCLCMSIRLMKIGSLTGQVNVRSGTGP